MAAVRAAFRRVILKLSGETLGRKGGEAFDLAALSFLCKSFRAAVEMGVELGAVVGGGNIIRGITAPAVGLPRVTADQMGMLATIINGLALREVLEREGLKTRLFSCLDVGVLAEPYHPRRAVEALEQGEIAIFAGGTGNPFVSTDTAAVFRACDIEAQVVLKATKVGGIYSADPLVDPSATRYDRVSYDEAMKLGLNIMDWPAIGLARANRIPVIVFNFWEAGALKKILMGEKIGSLLSD